MADIPTPAAPAPAAPAAAPTTAQQAQAQLKALPAKLDADLEAWFREHMTNTVVSQSTEVFNKVSGAFAALKAVIAKHL